MDLEKAYQRNRVCSKGKWEYRSHLRGREMLSMLSQKTISKSVGQNQKTTRSFYGLTDLVESIVKDLTEEKAKIVTCSREETRAQEEAKIREGKSLQEEKRADEEARNREVLVQRNMRAIEEARLRNFLQYPQSHVATAQHAQISTPIRESSEPRIGEGVRAQEEKRALEEGQAQKTLNFQRHLAAADHVQISRPVRETLRSAIVSLSRLNDSLYELHKPRGNPGLQILFFHSLQPRQYTEAHLSTWESRDGTTIWPKTWLIEEYSDAHVLTVFYNAGVRRNLQGASRIIVENLISDILQENIGQIPNCPVILVGHCFGGLVIKQLCVQAFSALDSQPRSARERVKLEKFLSSVKGIFYYGTPDHGSLSMSELDSPWLDFFKILSEEAARLNLMFNKFCASYPIRIRGLGESLPVKSGLFQGKVGVPEPSSSSREGDVFNVVAADQIDICRPISKGSRNFYWLTDLVKSIVKDLTKEEKESKEPQEAINSKVMARL